MLHVRFRSAPNIESLRFVWDTPCVVPRPSLPRNGGVACDFLSIETHHQVGEAFRSIDPDRDSSSKQIHFLPDLVYRFVDAETKSYVVPD